MSVSAILAKREGPACDGFVIPNTLTEFVANGEAVAENEMEHAIRTKELPRRRRAPFSQYGRMSKVIRQRNLSLREMWLGVCVARWPEPVLMSARLHNFLIAISI